MKSGSDFLRKISARGKRKAKAKSLGLLALLASGKANIEEVTTKDGKKIVRISEGDMQQ